MVLDKLGASLKNTLSKIAKAVFIDEKLINELIKDIQKALLQADVNVKLVFNLTNGIKERIKKEDTPKGLTKREQLVNIVYEALVEFLGKEAVKIEPDKKPFKIMLVGLFGSGKTTTAGKLAKYFLKRGKTVGVVGLDVHRPAAMDQLEQVAKKANVQAYTNKEEKDPIKIWNEHKEELEKKDIIIIDTAGRDALSDDLIKEIEAVNKAIQPDEKLLVISADIGQTAEAQAKKFHESCGITGVIATKMDGTAKAGGALSACAITQAPIKFIGVGEKLEDIESFNPKGFVGRLLGMGDLEALLEKAQGAISEEDAEDLSKRLLKGEFTLEDLYEQMEVMSKMGSIGKIMEMIPGMSQIKMPKDALKVQEGKLKKWKYVMDSMTKQEKQLPDETLNQSRIERISKGSGTSIADVRSLIKQYRQGKKMMKMFKGKDPEKAMGKMMSKMQQ
ncbi:MAG: signal recognition particle receptor subunit alpha [Nanoarchaeota archaeon]|nr:signal recognition particle receptor subunit alpha [Nanoarchaeota archaeon]